jgi:oligoendopeptidase F
MANSDAQLKALIKKGASDYKAFDSLATKTLAEIGKLQGTLKSAKPYSPDFKKKDWLKAATDAKADKKVLEFLKKIESKGQRDDCVSLVKLIKGKKELKKVEAEISALLAKDKAEATRLEKTMAKVSKLQPLADKLETVEKNLDPKFAKLIQAFEKINKGIEAGKKAQK